MESRDIRKTTLSDSLITRFELRGCQAKAQLCCFRQVSEDSSKASL